MRISRLDVLLLIVGLAAAGGVAWRYGWIPKNLPWISSQAAPVVSPKPPTPIKKSSPAGGGPAVPTSKPMDSPSATKPMADARQRLSGRAPVAAGNDKTNDQYEVGRGDTLWAIARDHSPVRAGAGWVGIWKANKALIKNFDRLEKGLVLMIPQERRAYVTRFWKPSRFVLARQDDSIDLAQLTGALWPTDLNPELLPAPEGTAAWSFAVTAFHQPPPSWLPVPDYY